MDEDLEKEMEENMGHSDSDISLNYNSDDDTLANVLRRTNVENHVLKLNREKVQQEKEEIEDETPTKNISQVSDYHYKTKDLLNRYFTVTSVKAWYVGLVTKIISAEKVEMTFLDRLGSFFRWPRHPKIEHVAVESILMEVFIEGEKDITLHPSIKDIEKTWIESKYSKK